MFIPDTIVINDQDLPPMWFYTSKEGYVYRTDLYNYRNVVSKFNKNTHPDEVVAVVKKVRITMSLRLGYYHISKG